MSRDINESLDDFETFSAKLKEAQQLKEEEELANKQNAYSEFFLKKLKKYKVASPAEMDEETRAKFFNEISKEWNK